MAVMSYIASKSNPIAFYLLLAIALALSGCVIHLNPNAGKGVTHTVKRGETLWRICRTYEVDMQDVAEINNIRNPAEIYAGSRLYIPGASEVKKVPSYSAPVTERESKYEGPRAIEMHKGMFEWPVRGPLLSTFGLRGGERHDGIDIKAPEGAPVKAAKNGEVVFVESDMRGYGRIIILKHDDDYFTVYAHNNENRVKRGDSVALGEVIATVGNSGNAEGSHLHFEVRHGKKVRNPLFFLP
jgi:murein DD-endopeptidase MepM/ murein hydrolase activator NlpD